MDVLQRHRERVLGCSLCFPSGDNAPVVCSARHRRLMLVGQAPGKTELYTRRPFSGPAGRRLEAWLSSAGVEREELYFASLARCFPGEKPGGGDRPPTKAMISNCTAHLRREMEILSPRVIVPVGGMAIKELMGLGRLDAAVGQSHHLGGIIYIPLPHPSGASTWTNSPEHRRLLERSLALLGEAAARERETT